MLRRASRSFSRLLGCFNFPLDEVKEPLNESKLVVKQQVEDQPA